LAPTAITTRQSSFITTSEVTLAENLLTLDVVVIEIGFLQIKYANRSVTFTTALDQQFRHSQHAQQQHSHAHNLQGFVLVVLMQVSAFLVSTDTITTQIQEHVKDLLIPDVVGMQTDSSLRDRARERALTCKQGSELLATCTIL
jgi:hypothetical protein